jgi:UDP:flavonoid glycosyltransferase YjiC (YdhE family)
VLPILRLARLCRERGHAALVAANPVYQSKAAELRVPFAAIGPRMAEPAPPGAAKLSFGPGDHARQILQRWLDPSVGEQTRECEAAIEAIGGCDAVVSSWITPGALVAAERRGIPLIFYCLHPLSLMQVQDFPIVADLPRLSRCAKRAPADAARLREALARRFAQSAPTYFAARRELRLSDYEGTLFEGPSYAAARLALFSPQMLRTAAMNAPTEVVGYPPASGEDGRGLPAEMRRFLEKADPPVLVSFGSVVSLRSRRLIAACVAAVGWLGRRAVVLTQATKRSGLVAEGVLLIRECSLSLLLPHCAALVTHAGIGTVGDALTAGLPVLSIPHYGDQFDNADRLQSLGIGRTLTPNDRGVEAIADGLSRLITDPSYRDRGSLLSEKLAAEQIVGRATLAIEGMAGLRDTS